MAVKLRSFLKLVHIKKLRVTYCPFQAKSTSASHIARAIQSPRVLATNTKCQVEVNIAIKEVTPTVTAEFTDGEKWDIDVTTMQYKDLWNHIMDKTEFIEGISIFGIDAFEKDLYPKNPAPIAPSS